MSLMHVGYAAILDDGTVVINKNFFSPSQDQINEDSMLIDVAKKQGFKLRAVRLLIDDEVGND